MSSLFPVFWHGNELEKDFCKMSGKSLVNHWKKTGNGTKWTYRLWPSPGHISTLEIRKRSLSVNLPIFAEKWPSPGILLDYCRRLSQTAKRTSAGNPWGHFVGVTSCVRCQSIALFALYCKKLNFLRDIRDFDSYISYRGDFCIFGEKCRNLSKCLER